MSTLDNHTINGESNRKDYLDVARGICMICIILGHLGDPFLNRFVFTFHLPVFYLITGYFFNPDNSLKTIVFKRSKGLLVPYYFACASILMFSFGINRFILNKDSVEITTQLKRTVVSAVWGAGDNWDQPFEIPGIGAIWFLWATFWGCVILHILMKITPIKRAVIVLGIFIFAKWTVENIGFAPLSIQPGCSAVLFIYIGYLWKTNERVWQELSYSVKSITCVFAALLWIEFIRTFGSFWLVHSDYGHGFRDVLSSLCASFLIIGISQGLDGKLGRLLAPIKLLGRYSIIALCAHIIELNTFPWWKITTEILGEDAPYVKAIYLKILIKVCWVFLVTFILSRFNVTRKIFNLKPIKRL